VFRLFLQHTLGVLTNLCFSHYLVFSSTFRHPRSPGCSGTTRFNPLPSSTPRVHSQCASPPITPYLQHPNIQYIVHTASITPIGQSRRPQQTNDEPKIPGFSKVLSLITRCVWVLFYAAPLGTDYVLYFRSDAISLGPRIHIPAFFVCPNSPTQIPVQNPHHTVTALPYEPFRTTVMSTVSFPPPATPLASAVQHFLLRGVFPKLHHSLSPTPVRTLF